jgi:secreted Zn-dependent insulinase-like peptidase
MNLDQSVRQLDDSLSKRSLIRSRHHILQDDVSIISTTSAYGSQTCVLLKEKTDNLYSHFLSVIQSSSNDMEIFDTVYHLRQILENTLDEMEAAGKKFLASNNWIRQEMNIWSLIHCLYKDRLITQKEEMEQDDLPLVNSEKLVVEHLYASEFYLITFLLCTIQKP